tara:strand:- start:367 stop:555 length:189 start_codon:yes stop_codon:yes gene_type:complete
MKHRYKVGDLVRIADPDDFSVGNSSWLGIITGFHSKESQPIVYWNTDYPKEQEWCRDLRLAK